MIDLRYFLENHGISFDYYENAFGDTIINLWGAYEIGQFDGDIEYTIADVKHLNFQYMDYNTLTEWILSMMEE